MVACRINQMAHEHSPVLLDKVLENLVISPNGIYVDATFGRGGHASGILERLGPQGKLFAMDKDPSAVLCARQKFSHDKRFVIQQGSFAELKTFLTPFAVTGDISGVLLDLGVSSPQLDDAARGFSFMREGQLDMRMDTTRGVTAAEWIATVSESVLANVLWEYGEERFSRRIAHAIVQARESAPIGTTLQLANIIKIAHPNWQPGKHPATQSFQAIRIFLNQELEDLKKGLAAAYDVLALQGRLLVISFHSLEDRIVKQFIRGYEKGPEAALRRLPIKNTFQPKLKSIGQAIKPDAEEIAHNPRSRSSILRIAEKLS